jgi:hypothetical protein
MKTGVIILLTFVSVTTACAKKTATAAASMERRRRCVPRGHQGDLRVAGVSQSDSRAAALVLFAHAHTLLWKNGRIITPNEDKLCKFITFTHRKQTTAVVLVTGNRSVGHCQTSASGSTHWQYLIIISHHFMSVMSYFITSYHITSYHINNACLGCRQHLKPTQRTRT